MPKGSDLVKLAICNIPGSNWPDFANFVACMTASPNLADLHTLQLGLGAFKAATPATIASFLRRLVFPSVTHLELDLNCTKCIDVFMHLTMFLHVTSVCVNTTSEDVEALATLYSVLPSATSMDLRFSSAAVIAALGCHIVPSSSPVLPELTQVFIVDDEWEELHVAL
ncbi:hypothetical protein B0H14DRAFT_3536182 [Mycena olivaceomarginata]|nr:hypothetical protein B0H14DRAFT_3536182 [Mycena olivaceomarginata]